MTEILNVRNLTKQYPGFLLDHLSFSLTEGRIVGFIGRNGAGKTTTLKALLGFISADEGDISFFGKPFSGNECAVKQEIGYISGGFDFYGSKKLRVISDVVRRAYTRWDEEVYRRCLKNFHLDEEKTPKQLSAGMRVKYGLTLALSHHAALLILDEPTEGLDPVSRAELLELFLKLKEEGTTIFFSCHIISDLEQVADDILYIREGKLIVDDTLDGFLDSYRVAELSMEEYKAVEPGLLIGCRFGKNGVSALVRTADAPRVGGVQRKADGEDIMIGLEKEETICPL